MMAQATSKIPILSPQLDKIIVTPYKSKRFGQLTFDFFEQVEESSSNSSDSSSRGSDGRESVDEDEGQEDEKENASSVEAANKAFWDSQEQLLLATLRRTTSVESKIRQATKEAIMELKLIGVNCALQNGRAGSCQRCTRYQIRDRLQKAGHSCTICKSKWRSPSEIPAGEHTYMEVATKKTSRKRDVRVIIELNFQAEFVIARPSEEYNHLISWLSEVFVGKVERFRTLIKILCSATKKYMKEKKMHMAPWRKQKYMRAKWLGRSDQFQPELTETLPMHSEKRPMARASILSFDLLDNLHHPTNQGGVIN